MKFKLALFILVAIIIALIILKLAAIIFYIGSFLALVGLAFIIYQLFFKDGKTR